MRTSQAGLDLIKRWEGLRLQAYRCSANVLTIGYGHTSAAGEPKVVEGMKITQADAEAILARDLGRYEAAVSKAITRPMTQPQFDALVSLCYNIGPGAFSQSTVARRFNAGDIAGAADAILMWNKAGGKELQGLTNRRQDERRMFLSAAPAPPAEPVRPAPAPLPPNAPETLPAPPAVSGQGIAAIVLGAIGALVAALAAWMMRG